MKSPVSFSIGRSSAAALWLVATLLGGCGFQLEGSGNLPSALAKTYVDTATPHTEFAGMLKSALRLRGSEIVDSEQEADAVLTISEDDTGQRVLSVSARNTPREFEIYYAVTFALRSGEGELIAPESLVATRSYTYNERQVLGKSAEERVLRRALAEDLARQIMRRIDGMARTAAAPIT